MRSMSSMRRNARRKVRSAWRTAQSAWPMARGGLYNLPFLASRYALCALPYVGVLLFGLSQPAQAQVATANNPHGKIKIPCNDCHSTKGWSPLRLDLKFRHEQTGFALEGQHAAVECKKCHA